MRPRAGIVQVRVAGVRLVDQLEQTPTDVASCGLGRHTEYSEQVGLRLLARGMATRHRGFMKPTRLSWNAPMSRVGGRRASANAWPSPGSAPRRSSSFATSGGGS